MDDFKKNIEKSRNTDEQLKFYDQLSNFIESPEPSTMKKVQNFPVFATRQNITTFIEKYEIYKLVKNIPGSIVECGVAAGSGLMTFAHLCSIFEPYHYTRKIIGFDTFEGFTSIANEDKSSSAKHMLEGGLNFGGYETLKEAISLYDKNRTLGHIPKVELVKGDLCKTFAEYLEQNPSLVIGLLYMDVDLYKPTKEVLKLAWERIPKGGVLVFDEINHKDYPGETIAAMEQLGIGNLRMQRLDISAMLSYCIKE
ncbi:class I SAM-dependent methyltransferase [Marinifilum sp. JC120]|nr:class I SAM-dependent methyltransferase [Marinifilum sp. JC120]